MGVGLPWAVGAALERPGESAVPPLAMALPDDLPWSWKTAVRT